MKDPFKASSDGSKRCFIKSICHQLGFGDPWADGLEASAAGLSDLNYFCVAASIHALNAKDSEGLLQRYLGIVQPRPAPNKFPEAAATRPLRFA